MNIGSMLVEKDSFFLKGLFDEIAYLFSGRIARFAYGRTCWSLRQRQQRRGPDAPAGLAVSASPSPASSG
jgi:hypothetical protein